MKKKKTLEPRRFIIKREHARLVNRELRALAAKGGGDILIDAVLAVADALELADEIVISTEVLKP